MAGTNIARRALRTPPTILIDPSSLFPNELAMINTAPDIKNEDVSLEVIFNNPTITPISASIIIHVDETAIRPAQITTARTTPIKKAQLPTELPFADVGIIVCFLGIFSTSFHFY